MLYGPINNANQLRHVAGLVEARPDHARVVAGGQRIGDRGYFYQATVVADLEQSDELIQTEVFGPVITVQRFTDEDDAVAKANDSEYGLASSVWTVEHHDGGPDVGPAGLRLRLDQHPHPAPAEMPHGGFKHSGYGKDLSLYGMGGLHADQARHGVPRVRGRAPETLGHPRRKGWAMADKGLKANSVGLFGGTLLGISSVAPAYVLTATVGILAVAVAEKTPVVIIAGFLPMFFAAYAYREFNTVMPDSGTSFTGRRRRSARTSAGSEGGTAVIATIIVLSNLAGVAVQFLYQFIGAVVRSETISGLWENKPINVITCLAFLAIATWVAYRGIDATEKVQIVLVSFQMVVLLLFAIMAFAKHEMSGVGADFSWSWFSPAGIGLSAFIVGLSGSYLRLLGLGHRADRQRGVEGLRPRPRPGRAALRLFHPGGPT